MCPVIFLAGCNFRCPYCLNADLVFPSADRKPIPLEEIERYVKDNGEEHILISGGEPCLDPGLGPLVDALKAMGLKVRLSTNGSMADVLEDMVFRHGVSFVAMDLKTDINDRSVWGAFMQGDREVENVRRSMGLLHSTLYPADSTVYPGTSLRPADGFSFEFRTTLYPPYVGEEEIFQLSFLIDENAVWYLQQFRPREGLLDPAASTVRPFTQGQLDRLLSIARKRVKRTELRWP